MNKGTAFARITYSSPAVWLAATVALTLAGNAFATNGYFAHGYGAKSKSMAGASTALPQDSLTTASNPAGIVRFNRRLDTGIDFFIPRRGGAIRGNQFGADDSFDGNDTSTFIIPEFGYVHRLNEKWSWAFTAYGNGGMNTSYRADNNPFARFGSAGEAGVDLAQLFVGPSVAYRITPTMSIGLSVNYALQRFEATGLAAFATTNFPGPFSDAPENLTDQGHDYSDGIALRFGWLAEFGRISLGAGYQPKVRMGEFDKYRGLFAEQGGFDIPENYSLGIAWHATPDLTAAFDYQRINYGGVPSVANSLAKLQNPDAAANDPMNLVGNRLGSSNGPGFAWQDVKVFKFGLSYALNEAITLRAGFSDLDQPVPEGETLLNILAPGVVEKHYTVGATYVHEAHEVSFHAMHAPRVHVRGQQSIPTAAMPIPPASFGGGEADIHLKETLVGISYGFRFR